MFPSSSNTPLPHPLRPSRLRLVDLCGRRQFGSLFSLFPRKEVRGLLETGLPGQLLGSREPVETSNDSPEWSSPVIPCTDTGPLATGGHRIFRRPWLGLLSSKTPQGSDTPRLPVSGRNRPSGPVDNKNSLE